jgi:hypothetical protein
MEGQSAARRSDEMALPNSMSNRPKLFAAGARPDRENSKAQPDPDGKLT